MEMDRSVVMFEKILIAVPMEAYPEKAIFRARDIMNTWNSNIVVAYVIENNILDVATDQSQHVLTGTGEKEWQNQIIKIHTERAREIVVSDVEKVLGRKINHFSVERGMYSDVIIDLIKKYDSDIIIVEQFPQSFIRLRILDSSPVHIWVERNPGMIKKVGLFCTNANPNIKAPPVAREIAQRYSAEFSSFFIFDPAFPGDKRFPDAISRDHDLHWNAISKGKIEDVILRTVRKKKLDLIIIGRVETYRFFSLRHRILRKASCNVLFIR
jgi:nucleotide-binding universal stress UspA family protein